MISLLLNAPVIITDECRQVSEETAGYIVLAAIIIVFIIIADYFRTAMQDDDNKKDGE